MEEICSKLTIKAVERRELEKKAFVTIFTAVQGGVTKKLDLIPCVVLGPGNKLVDETGIWDKAFNQESPK